MTRTLIIGAGLSGLVRAHLLASRGEDVLVLEAGDRPGGVVVSDALEGFLIERGPNTVRPTPELWSLVSDLGLLSEVELAPASATRYLDWGGRLHAMPAGPVGLLGTKLGKMKLPNLLGV